MDILIKNYHYSMFIIGNTAGLLGYWNDNKDQEFLLPNGSFISTNSSDRTIHNEFGQKCKFVNVI